MACRLFGAKPLSEPIVDYYQLDPWEQISGKMDSKYNNFSCRKMNLKMSSAKWWPFCLGLDVLIRLELDLMAAQEWVSMLSNTSLPLKALPTTSPATRHSLARFIITLSLVVLNLFKETLNIFVFSIISQYWDGRDWDLFIWWSQYHDCWWLGDRRCKEPGHQ